MLCEFCGNLEPRAVCPKKANDLKERLKVECMSDMTGTFRFNENGKAVIEPNKPKTLWGIPIVVSDAVPPGTAIIGRFPTWQEVVLHGSFEKAIEAQKREWAMIKGLPTE